MARPFPCQLKRAVTQSDSPTHHLPHIPTFVRTHLLQNGTDIRTIQRAAWAFRHFDNDDLHSRFSSARYTRHQPTRPLLPSIEESRMNTQSDHASQRIPSGTTVGKPTVEAATSIPMHQEETTNCITKAATSNWMRRSNFPLLGTITSADTLSVAVFFSSKKSFLVTRSRYETLFIVSPQNPSCDREISTRDHHGTSGGTALPCPPQRDSVSRKSLAVFNH